MTLRERGTIGTRPALGEHAPGRALSCAAGAPRSRRGFSLVEFGMVLGVVAVVAVIAAPRYANAQARYRAEVAIQRVGEDLKRAQAIARSSSSAVTVTFNPGSPRYTVKPAAGMTWSAAQFKGRSDSLTDLSVSPYLGTVSDAQFGGDAAVSFDAFGNADTTGVVVLKAGDWGAGLKMNSDGTVTKSVFRWPTVASPIATNVPAEIAAAVPATPKMPGVIDETAPDVNVVATLAGTTPAAGGGATGGAAAPAGGGGSVTVAASVGGDEASLVVGGGGSTQGGSKTTSSSTTSAKKSK